MNGLKNDTVQAMDTGEQEYIRLKPKNSKSYKRMMCIKFRYSLIVNWRFFVGE